MIYYTGTGKNFDEARASQYRKGIFVNGFEEKCVSDVGDFGSGLYADKSKYRASLYGKFIFRLEVDLSRFLNVGSPYSKEDYPLWLRKIMFKDDQILTIAGTLKERKAVADKIKDICKAMGFTGMLGTDNEIVIFSNDAIVSWVEVTPQNVLSFIALGGTSWNHDKSTKTVRVINPDLMSFGFEGELEHLLATSAKIRFGFGARWISTKNLAVVPDN